MSRLDNLPEQDGSNTQADQAQTAESLLRAVAQDLRSLQQGVLTELNQDISRLQAEKSRLLNDIEKLQTQQQALQAQHSVDLSQQQLAQQQAWAKQLALVLANHLQTALNERLNQTLGAYQAGNLPQISAAPNSEQSYRLAASLDETVNRTFASLRHDINSYQSSLGQQLERMHTMSQQGEAILEVLVKRLSQQLQNEARSQGGQRPSLDTLFPPREISPPPINPPQIGSSSISAPVSPSQISPSQVSPPQISPPASKSRSVGSPPAASELVPSPNPSRFSPSSGLPQPSTNPFSWSDALSAAANDPHPEFNPEPDVETSAESSRPARLRRTNLKLGLGLAFLSALVISLHYVLVGIVGNASQLFGQQAIGGYLRLDTFGSAALLLWIRMLVVIPLLVGLATRIYPPTLREVRAFSRSTDRRMLISLVGSGIFLFLSQVLLYVAIGQMGPGVAVTTLFIYPIGSLIFGWLLFAEKLTFSRTGILVAILLGAALAVFPVLTPNSPAQTGIVAGVLAAVTFTLYLLVMQIGARKIHPVPISLVQFATMFVLSSFSLIVLGFGGQPRWTPLLISGALLGILTLGSYALNHFAIRSIGPSRSSIIAASTPALTALLAFFLVPDALTTLNVTQIIGILIVTLGGTALSLERMLLQNKTGRQAKPKEQELKAQEEG
jgi:drug/metabolite transporter (DMT)-like permease